MRTLGLASFFVLLTLFLPAASGAGNHTVFADAVGDNEGGIASDIISVDVTSEDDGSVSFKITLSDPGARLYDGDFLTVGIESDGNMSNGLAGTGYDNFLSETGSSTGSPTFRLCSYVEREDCSSFLPDEASDVPTGSTSHLVTFSISQGGWTVISFFVFESYEAPSGTSYTDSTPAFKFDVNADPDRDGFTGSDDSCPTIKAGKTKKQDGCPDVLPQPRYTYVWADSSAPVVAFREFRVTGAPPGTTVTVRYPGGVAHRRGSGMIKALARRPVHVGSLVTISFSSPTRFGRFLVLRVNGGGVGTVRTGCTSVGSTKPLPRCP